MDSFWSTSPVGKIDDKYSKIADYTIVRPENPDISDIPMDAFVTDEVYRFASANAFCFNSSAIRFELSSATCLSSSATRFVSSIPRLYSHHLLPFYTLLYHFLLYHPFPYYPLPCHRPFLTYYTFLSSTSPHSFIPSTHSFPSFLHSLIPTYSLLSFPPHSLIPSPQSLIPFTPPIPSSNSLIPSSPPILYRTLKV